MPVPSTHFPTVEDAVAATELRNKAWGHIGFTGRPQEAVFKREGAEPPPVRRDQR